MVLDIAAEENAPPVQQWLYRCDDGSRFAYARGDEFIRNGDHTLWARLFEDRLVSVRSGDCLAYRVGTEFYDAVSNEAVYTSVPAAPSPLPARSGSQAR